VRAVAGPPDRPRLATASNDRTARLWAADGGTLLNELIGHTGLVRAVAWSPDGTRLATAANDRTARLWSADGIALHELTGHANWVLAVAWSPDGSRLATAAADRTARVWPNPPSPTHLLEDVAKLPGMPVLTTEQRRRFSLPVQSPSRDNENAVMATRASTTLG
jgi:WD40 repeat protein